MRPAHFINSHIVQKKDTWKSGMTIEGEHISERRDDQAIEMLIYIHEGTVSPHWHARQISWSGEDQSEISMESKRSEDLIWFSTFFLWLVVGTDQIAGWDFPKISEDYQMLKRADFHGEKKPVFKLKNMLEKILEVSELRAWLPAKRAFLLSDYFNMRSITSLIIGFVVVCSRRVDCFLRRTANTNPERLSRKTRSMPDSYTYVRSFLRASRTARCADLHTILSILGKSIIPEWWLT